jgi:hypothetical protein
MREHENVWAKLNGAERLSVSGSPGYDDFVTFARHIARTYPDRVIWGTDWPHPNMTSHMPDEGDLVDLIPRIAPAKGPAAPAARRQPNAPVLEGPIMRIALAGTGAFGIKHLDGPTNIDGVTVTALVSRTPGQAEEIARKSTRRTSGCAAASSRRTGSSSRRSTRGASRTPASPASLAATAYSANWKPSW